MCGDYLQALSLMRTLTTGSPRAEEPQLHYVTDVETARVMTAFEDQSAVAFDSLAHIVSGHPGVRAGEL